MVHDTYDPGCRRLNELKLAGFLPRSTVNGPGTRAVVWVQGCPIRCNGCFNPGFLPFSGSLRVPVEDIAARILAVEGIEGVTFTGGEPFAHAAPLAELGRILKPRGISIATFTGYSPDCLMAKNRRSWQDLLSVTDILYAGPYSVEMTDEKSGCEISLQLPQKRIIQLRDGRIVSDTPMRSSPVEEIEFAIGNDGRIVMTGFPEASEGHYDLLRCSGG